MQNIYLMIILALIQYLWFSSKVGSSRGKYGVKAPATTGSEEWERIYRVQQNTLEQIVVFIPALYIFAELVSAKWALIPAGLYLVGRQLYAMTYVKDPSKRVLGMVLTFGANVVLLLGTLYGVARGWM